MNKLFIYILALVFISTSFTFNASAEDTSEEIKQLKEQVQKLLNRIEELEKKQAKTESKIIEKEKEIEEKGGILTGYNNGFYLKTRDENYLLKINLQLQFRYTYLAFDRIVQNNNEDWNNFFFRRVRLFLKGNAINKDWLYYLCVQLEPQDAVNLIDGYVTWAKYPHLKFQFGRSKIPYGLEYWQSGALLNGVARSILSGETDVDGKYDNNRYWPGGNANFPNVAQDSNTLYPTGGFNLYRSQGIVLLGDIDSLGSKGFLQYWLGVFNGPNTRGRVNLDSYPLWTARISINPFGKQDLTQQGDIDNSRTPKLSLLFSGMQYNDRTNKLRSATTDANNDGLGDVSTVSFYDIEGRGYNIAVIFRYRGFSTDIEYGYDWFKQIRTDGYKWDRFAYRFNTGYFIIPEKLETTARYVYVERLKSNSLAKSYASGLGIINVKMNGVTTQAIEDNLREYTVGLNYYFNKHKIKLLMDYSHLVRELIPSAGVPVNDQRDNRFRTQFQYYF